MRLADDSSDAAHMARVAAQDAERRNRDRMLQARRAEREATGKSADPNAEAANQRRVEEFSKLTLARLEQREAAAEEQRAQRQKRYHHTTWMTQLT